MCLLCFVIIVFCYSFFAMVRPLSLRNYKFIFLPIIGTRGFRGGTGSPDPHPTAPAKSQSYRVR